MRKTRFRRRDFLVSTAAALLPATLPGIARFHQVEPKTGAEVILGDLASARQVGRAYLALAPAEADPVALAALLPSGCTQSLRKRGDLTALRDAINCQRRREFASGETVLLDGWVLARTEARLAAFVTLVSAASGGPLNV